MTSDCIDNDTAKKLVKRVCKALSKKINFKISPCFFSTSRVVLVIENDSAIIFESPTKYAMHFDSSIDLLDMVLSKRSKMTCYPLGKPTIELDLNTLFGNTVEELKISLDLMKV